MSSLKHYHLWLGWGLCLFVLSSPVQSSALAERAFALYGDTVEYAVYRRDAPIGTHTLRFSKEDGLLRVDVEMDLQIRYLALFSYRYRYQATEWWQDEQLVRLEVSVDDNGDLQQIVGQQTGALLRVEAGGAERMLEPELITTNHWNSAIVEQTRVLNTLTGQASEIAVEVLGAEQVPAGETWVDATRYRLGGELIDTDTWYDDQGRWLGMEFSATDRSRIRLISTGIALP